ncbi:MAG: dipeptide/oligopeptide/nickel ABC transporter permease/ATP-binding protein [Gammaproteobacteria bacterium]|jgi:peptide/nickel transport system permease protein
MSSTAETTANIVKPTSSRPGVWARLKRNHLAVFGLLIISLIGLIALFAPLLPLPDPDATALSERLQKPFTENHLLGTDHLGRDILSRIVWGTRVSLAVGVVATLIAAITGSIIGIVAGFYGRWLDNILMRSIDMVMAFPYMLLALAIVAVLGPGLMNALFAIAIVNIPFFARSVRGVTLGLVRQEYVDAARLSGLSDARILGGEILPNVLPVIIITMSTTVGWMILETAGLSFLGLGAQPPQADLGSMLGEGRKLVITAPHVATIPGLVILFLVVGINLLGDGLRDILDPRLKSGALVRPAAATEVDDAVRHRTADDDTNPDAALTVSDLKTHFVLGQDVYKAVDGVSFEILPGECLGIVGESGCGKSVTALSLLGLVPTPPGRIVSGRVEFGTQNLLTAPLEKLRSIRGGKIAYVFQDPLTTLNPLFPVGEQIAESIREHQGLPGKLALQRAVTLMEQVQIPNAKERAQAYPHELSGGMRQRIGIAMALANDPEVIIADEPTTALDVTVQAEILRLLDDLRREKNVAVVFITHDFGVVSELCDRVLVMYAGQVVEVASTDDIFTHPLHPYTQQLMACVPRLGEADKVIAAIPGIPPAVNDLPKGCAFADRCERAQEACLQSEIALRSSGKHRAVRCIRVDEASQ